MTTQKGLGRFIKVFWLPILAVLAIGQLQIVYAFVMTSGRPSEIVLRVTQALWVLIIFASIYYAMRKKSVSLKQALFAGFLFFIAFSVMIVLVRWLVFGHDIISLITGPFVYGSIYVCVGASVGVFAAVVERRLEKK